MAAPSWHVGHYFQRNSRILVKNFEQFWGHRSFGWTPALRQQATEANKEPTETIVVPRKKTWSKEAVLEALAATVGRDPTSYPYQLQDDPFLGPRSSSEYKLFSLSQESGKSAARYFITTYPQFFAKDFAEPHIPCLMPETVMPRLEEVSEEALKERISLRKVTAAVDMYDQLLQAGTSVSMETIHDLLDLICLYCDKDPVQEGEPAVEDAEGSGKEEKRRRAVTPRASALEKSTWKDDNNAERFFNLLPERDTRCYSALIRGMVKHGAYAKAFSFYTDMLNNRLTADIHIFHALILAAPEVREKYSEKWDLVTELLNQMSQQKVQPNLLTFNTVLRALKRCGYSNKSQALHTLSEMKALGIAPSLATYKFILEIFYRTPSSGQSSTGILQEVMSELEGTRFTCQDPEDVFFFSTAMKVCLDYKDLELAYRVHSLLEFGDNWRCLGDSFLQNLYYGRFFTLLCLMEHIDEVLKWYRRVIPSLYFPHSQGLRDLLQALDTDNRLDLLPTIWKDICYMGHDNRPQLVEELLTLMARERHSPEVQESFAACALDVKKVYDGEGGRSSLEWTNTSMSHITTILLRANKTQQAWNMLQLFKSKNRVPREEILDEFLTVFRSEGSSQKAVDLVQLSTALCLGAAPRLAKQVLAEFEVTEEQRAVLSELESAEERAD